jgi:branched-chain amino acid transport system substrate-binding protein
MPRKFLTALSAIIPFALVFILRPCIAEAENLAVGVLLPLSGPNAVIGHMQKNAMLLALEEINSQGDVDGRPLELDIRDVGDRPTDAGYIVGHFIMDKQYPLIIGGGVSSVAAEAARLCQKNRTPLLVVTGSEDSITSQGLSYIFRVAPPRSQYGAAALEFAREMVKPGRVALVTERSSFGNAMSEAVRSAAKKEGWSVIRETRIEFGNMDLAEIRDGVGDSGADAVFLAVFPPDARTIMAEIRFMLPRSVLFSLAPSSLMAGTFNECGEECRGMFNSALWWVDGESSARLFRDQYREKYGLDPDYHGAQAYTAVLAAASALRRVDGTDREAVRVSLKATRIGSPLGTVSFQKWGGFENQNRPKSYLFQWFGDRFEVVWPENLRTADAVLPGKR